MIANLNSYILPLVFVFTSTASSQVFAQQETKECELHFWPTSQVGAVFFGASNFQLNGSGVGYDLIQTTQQLASEKARKEFDTDKQQKAALESIIESGKYVNYKVIKHGPLPQSDAFKYSNLLDKSIGLGPREINSSVPCYAELHVAFITLFKTALSKKFMSGYVLRHFPENPNDNANNIEHSNLNRGQETARLAKFDFNSAIATEEESNALISAFKTTLGKFLQRK